MEKGQYQAAVVQAQGAIESAEAALALTNIEVERQTTLVAKSAAPQNQLDLAIAKQSEAKGSLTQLNATLDKAKLDLSYTEIRAPIDGRIGRSVYSIGNFIGPSSNVLATIVSQDPIYVSFSVSQREILAIREKLASKGTLGSTVDAAVVYVELADRTRYAEPGKVSFVDVTTDQGTDTVPVRATLPNPNRILVDGQLVTVIVEGGTTEKSLVVPQAAIQVDQSGPYALVVNSENKIEGPPYRGPVRPSAVICPFSRGLPPRPYRHRGHPAGSPRASCRAARSQDGILKHAVGYFHRSATACGRYIARHHHCRSCRAERHTDCPVSGHRPAASVRNRQLSRRKC